MPESFVGLPADAAGKKLRTRQRTVGANVVDEQYVITMADERLVSFGGRAATFRAPGRAGTTGASLLQIVNAAGSGIIVSVDRLTVDVMGTAVMGVTVIPPVIRLYKLTAAATGGGAVVKTPDNTLQTSNAGVTLLQDATADGTLAATALGATIPANLGFISQEYMPRLITAAGYEVADRLDFLAGEKHEQWLHPGQAMLLRLDYTVATANPASNHWLTTLRWSEFTLP